MVTNTGEQLVRTHESNKSSQQMCNYYNDNDNTIRISAHKIPYGTVHTKYPKGHSNYALCVFDVY